MTRIFVLIFSCCFWLPPVSGQPTLPNDFKKPQKFENKTLGSEKTSEKKFHWFRRFTQNGVTKFNWHFNAATKLDEVIATAKARHKDDYNHLLSFYNYSLDQTAQEKIQLDSVIYKANAGILTHDLRNQWIDNLFMLMGEAYYFRKDFDSAYLTFQYINYAFSPKEDDGYDIPIGSNASEGGNAFTISTKEKNSLFNKVWSRPPSRNESFLWQIRTYLAKDEMAEAAGMIQTLRNDPNFPKRLETGLYEMQAHWFYKQNIYDSAAIYLEKALDNTENKEERARWEYLIGQLYEQAGKHEMAEIFFKRTIKHTLDPVREVYARLNAIRQNKGDEKAIQENINDLLKMARRDRYTFYRDIIYYTAAQIELERNNIAGAKALLIKAARYSNPTSESSMRTKAFLVLADLSYREKLFRDAKSYYDSVTVADITIISEEKFKARKDVLAKIVAYTETIERQDSLQRVAAMPETEREDFIRKLVKKLRKQQGLSEDEFTTTGNPFNNNNAPPPDLFGNNAKGEWYFYNSSLKSKGYTEFKGKWGNRPNVDNWRRSAAAINQNANRLLVPGRTADGNNNGAGEAIALTYEELLNRLPLTEEKIKISNDSIENAQFQLGKTYLEGLEEYEAAIATLEEFLTRFPYSNHRPEALQLLYYCYTKTGNTVKANETAAELRKRFAGTEYEKKISAATGNTGGDEGKTAMTQQYENIYNLFIEGNFEEALAQKRLADSMYGNHYWTPQLLYIQSVYHIQQRQDPEAQRILQDLMKLYPASPLAAKAKTLSEVLSRRKEIEDYLTNLEIERPQEDTLTGDTALMVRDHPDTKPTNVQTTQPVVKKSDPANIFAEPPPAKRDSVTKKPEVVTEGPAYKLDVIVPHYVVIVMDKVDPVYVTETRNAFNRYNRQRYAGLGIEINNDVLSDDLKLVVMSNFENAAVALDYLEATRATAGSVIPWLPANKYSFIVISANNLEILKSTQDLEAYKKFLATSFPEKFK